jgi:hypothetical protein
LGQIAAFKAVERQLTSVRDVIVVNPSEAKWIRVDGEEPGD